ncbi:MAG: arginine--tRNA ligase [Candidatus Nanopelagicaceae bacterium]|nr:arginine--tRNA ligase [Actinomycetota bacterium]NCV43320.1 arginine--tRNA ligase [Actinomycetota bacterium]NCV83567.1 arginine--tRNA ligase [Actinomycetota bacterium]NCV95365.1 arginine--tRNA ligase [Actinomycetota bacterium]NCW96687.1 arginine--tRNA ligase [Actinomycetota bacterium]
MSPNPDLESASPVAALSGAILEVVSGAFASGAFVGDVAKSLTADRVPLERPKNREHGDYATSIALSLAKSEGKTPREIALVIKSGLEKVSGVAKVEIAGPGFINVTLDKSSQGAIVSRILKERDDFGKVKLLSGVKINLEFISANPTGPLHLGHTRWAAVGDALASVLAAAGAEVVREFYVNDRGTQMDLFGASIRAAALEIPRPEDGYQGGYIDDLAKLILTQHPEYKSLPEAEGIAAFREAGYALQLQEQKDVLDNFGTHFDVWFSERSLHSGDSLSKSLAKLKSQGHLFELDGATWLRTTDFGDDKDRVLIKSGGELTYFASDTAYYIDKRERGFDICIYMLGADHHGYVGRLKATAACAGDDPNYNVHVLIGQLVKIMEGGQELKLSKRAGTIITLEELVAKVGVDAARYTLIRYPVDTPMTLDVDLLKRRTNDNPVYYVQYAHARIAALLRNATELGIKVGIDNYNPELLTHDRERELLGGLAQFPEVVSSAAELRQPHRVARYIEELATLYHGFYSDCRVLPMGEEKPGAIHSTRATLCEATRQTIFNGLTLLGVSAPERM